MNDTRTADQVLDVEFLMMRAKILELAAALDRIQRADGSADDEIRMRLIERGLQILCDGQGNHAERIRMLFSREYAENWRAQFEV